MTEPLDSADFDALQELERSRGYQLFAERINQVLEGKRNDLERPATEAATHYLRGEIAGLRLVLRLPGVIKHEIWDQIKK